MRYSTQRNLRPKTTPAKTRPAKGQRPKRKQRGASAMPSATPDPSSPVGPLAGLKVVELGQLIAGPFAAKTLADFGAEVVKIETPGTGDPLRKWRLLKDGTSVWWQVQSRSKRSLALDLRQTEAQDIVRELVREADV